MYRTFRDKHDSCIKVVMKPGAQVALKPCIRLTCGGPDMPDERDI